MLESSLDSPRQKLLAGLSAAERQIRLAGTQTTLLEAGDGPPVVLLHGPAANATNWTYVIPELSRAHRVIAPDLPGHGSSESSDDVLAWLGALIDETCSAPPVVVGHALGAAIAARFALAHGGRVKRLVLVDALGLEPFNPAPELGQALDAFMTRPVAETHDELWRRCTFDLDGLQERMGDTWDAFAAYNLDRANTPSVAAALGTLLAQFAFAPIAGLERIDVPVALVWGRHDPVTSLTVAEQAGERYGWPLHVLESCGADAPVEQPEALLRALDAEALRERLDGELLLPGGPGFAAATDLWNGMIVKTPAYVVQPTGTADVAAAVGFARAHNLVIAVRGGGHHVGGTALADGGLTIDMSRLREVVVDPDARIATVDPGCRLGDLDRAAQEHGLALPLGFMSEVGVAGLTLGGGLGYLTRRFGWTVDSLRGVEIVTADGGVRRADRHENADLFWAVRGAGANLGVVTSFKFDLHEVGPMAVGGLIAWPFVRAEEILDAYRTMTAAAPRELAVWLLMVRAPAAPFVPPHWHGELTCAMAVCYTGDLALADEALAPIRALGEPIFDMLAERPYAQVQSYLDALEPRGEHYYWRTEYAAELNDGLLANQRALAASCPIPRAQVGFLHVGGALNEHAGDDGAVGNRDAHFACGVIASWEPGEPRAEEFKRWVREAGESMRPFATGGGYVNFQMTDEGQARVRAAYGANYDRLAAIKHRYDPDNLFRSNRNVPPA